MGVRHRFTYLSDYSITTIKNINNSNNNNIHILGICLLKVMKNILVTDGAGFIGIQVLKRLLSFRVNKIIVIDNLSNAKSEFSDCILKKESEKMLSFYKEDIRNKKAILDIVKGQSIDVYSFSGHSQCT
jgi:FlaA1/EpsC-like NDP-sugar epimerase